MEIAVEFFMEIRYNNLVLAADTGFPQTWREECMARGRVSAWKWRENEAEKTKSVSKICNYDFMLLLYICGMQQGRCVY